MSASSQSPDPFRPQTAYPSRRTPELSRNGTDLRPKQGQCYTCRGSGLIHAKNVFCTDCLGTGAIRLTYIDCFARQSCQRACTLGDCSSHPHFATKAWLSRAEFHKHVTDHHSGDNQSDDSTGESDSISNET